MSTDFSTRVFIPLLTTVKKENDNSTPKFIEDQHETPMKSNDSTVEHTHITSTAQKPASAEILIKCPKPVIFKPQAQRTSPDFFGFRKLYGSPCNYQKTVESHCQKKIYFNTILAALIRKQVEKQRFDKIAQLNKDNFLMRLSEIARNFGNIYTVLRPSKNTNFGQWGHRLYSPRDIDTIILQSKLVRLRVEPTTTAPANNCPTDFSNSDVAQPAVNNLSISGNTCMAVPSSTE